ncbi:MAG: hypothetical protein LBI96_00105 [Odoribacteraceae bacterium]|jgi:hypothetical protein|nr:hypothetical protein [Odoribacteraceae bacterium]
MMKTIFQLSILLLALTIPRGLHGQHLDSLPVAERDSFLLKVAKETVMKYGPDYYRDHQPPTITKTSMSTLNSSYGQEHGGRLFYVVKYPADEAREICPFAASVLVWADTGKAFNVHFGCGFGYGHLEEIEREGRILDPVPYQKDLSKHYWDSLRRVNPWPKQ